MSDATIITLRLPKSFVDRADGLIAQLAEDEEALLAKMAHLLLFAH